jgi:hypothetical protein
MLSAPGSSDGGMPNGRGMSGADANRIRSISDSWIRLVLARRFWNQILTCVSVSLSWLENSARSEMERYCFSRNFFSREFSCCVVKGVRGLRLGLCFRRVHLSGPVGALNPRPERKMIKYNLRYVFKRNNRECESGQSSLFSTAMKRITFHFTKYLYEVAQQCITKIIKNCGY